MPFHTTPRHEYNIDAQGKLQTKEETVGVTKAAPSLHQQGESSTTLYFRYNPNGDEAACACSAARGTRRGARGTRRGTPRSRRGTAHAAADEAYREAPAPTHSNNVRLQNTKESSSSEAPTPCARVVEKRGSREDMALTDTAGTPPPANHHAPSRAVASLIIRVPSNLRDGWRCEPPSVNSRLSSRGRRPPPASGEARPARRRDRRANTQHS
ncbi:unnamed protein product [Plutella xylostella]|uniref:(diamondback moth) hypothetical protein n=1 Tax=Plutella xylostella TaxID=51655 RepID=A0A8S4EIH4_PLUXY|nr:unnamed protein product [Plutella xylostella]